MSIHRLATLPIVLLALLLVPGCSDDTDVTVSGSSDCIITNMTLGTLNRYLVTKDSLGRDSTYRVTVTGSLYPLTIDHIRRPEYEFDGRIWNRDSLPYGTDVSHIVFSAINTTGGVVIRSLTTAQDTAFAAADSTDFTLPRLVTVYASDGESKRSYEVCINVHKEEGDSLRWHAVGSSDRTLLRGLTAMTAIAADGRMMIYGTRNDSTLLATIPYSATTEGTSDEWTLQGTDTPLLTDNIQRASGAFYALGRDNRLHTSADGIHWTAVTTSVRPTSLLAGGTDGLSAIADGAFLKSTDATEWTTVENDEADSIPAGRTTSAHLFTEQAGGQEVTVAIGELGGHPVVWRRTILNQYNEAYPWIHIPAAETNQYNCPALQEMTLFTYDGATCLVGIDADGMPSPIYTSRDNGRTWIPGQIALPLTIAMVGNHHVVAVSDEYRFIWYVDTLHGTVWRGRHNRLGWAQ